MKLDAILKKYDTENITIGVLGGHSALEVCEGAKLYGFKTLVVCQEGREKTYKKYYKTRGENGSKGCVDEVLVLPKFADIVKPEIQEELRKRNTIFIHNRYFWVYCNFDEIEKDFKVPIYGNREMLRLEERDALQNQYWLLEKAGIRMPKQFAKKEYLKSKTMDGKPVIVKVSEAMRSYERAFFVSTSPRQYLEESERLIKEGKITREALDKALIEEFIVGAQVNCNFFYSQINGELELMGTDTRRQTSLDGFLRLNAQDQLQLLNAKYKPTMVETGHIAVTVKESLLEKMFEMGEKFVKTAAKHAAPGIIGPFALQGAVDSENGKEEFVIFDVSLRIPGSPGTRFTPYGSYLWGHEMSYGERIAMELSEAIHQDRWKEILT